MSRYIKHILIGLLLICGSEAWAAKQPTLKVYDVDVSVNEPAQLLDIVLKLNMKDYKMKSNGEAIFTPVIISENGTDSVVFSPITICGRNRYYYHMRNDKVSLTTQDVYRAGSNELVTLRDQVPLQPWMLEDATVEVRQQAGTCCSKPKTIVGNSKFGNVLVARLNRPAPAAPQFDYEYVFAPPVEQGPVKKSLEGKAFVTFVVNKTDLDPKYMNNPAEIRKILNSIDLVKSDPDAQITEVHIRGYASPEGPYENNVRLAKGRTETLANYVNGLYKFPAGIMTTSYDPEDWGGLRAYVKDSMNFNLTNRAGLLAVIDGPLGFDARDAALRSQFPQDYSIILNKIYPWLRHSDYAVKYTIKVYTELSDLMRLYNTDATKLRPVDFYTIAQQYPIGSKEYLDVMRKAIQVYPDDPMINLNVANIYLMDGEYDDAQSCLLKAGQTPQANYARGVLAAKRGDYRDADKWFKKAYEGGITQAEQYIDQIDKSQNQKPQNPVEILLKPTR